MPFTYFLDNALINEIFGGLEFAQPATVYLALSTTAPNQAGTGVTEPVGNGYARAAVTNNATNWPNATNGAKSNGTVITFPVSTGSWGTVTHFGIYDAATAGNLLAYGTLNNPQTVSSGDTLSFAVGALDITLN